jgi:hypothetical protein
MATSIRRAQSRQTKAPFGHRRGRRDLHPRVLQGSQGRSGQTCAPPRRQSRQARPLGRADSSRGGSRPQRRHVRRRPPCLDAASLKEALGERIPPSTDFCCDSGAAITAFAKRTKLKIHVLPAPGNPKPEEPQFHINNVNANHGRLKGWMRRFHGVATENSPTYLSWRRTLEATPAPGDPPLWIAAAAGLGPYQHELQ